MESFFLAETTKYLYLLFDRDHWLHNTGQTGTVVKVGQRQCVVEAGGYIYNSGILVLIVFFHNSDFTSLFTLSVQIYLH